MNKTASNSNTATALWERWGALWNGDISQAEEILTTDFTVHAALVGMDERAVQGPRGLAAWVALLRAALGEPTFTIEVGPVIDGNLICGRWHVRGRYAGGFPGATATPGTPVDFTGTDVLRIDDGRLAEYWLNSDVHIMAAQLGMTR